MKDSGIAWVGEIPQEWQSVRSKFIIQSNDGGVWGGEPTDTDLDKIVLRSTEQTIEGKWKITSPAYRNLSTVAYKNCLIRPNDLLITKSSGSALHIGKTSLANLEFANCEYYYSNFLQRIRVNEKYTPKYAWYIFNSTFVRVQFAFLQNATSGLGNINSEDIESVYIPLPPIDEQKRIVNYLDRECEKIDGLKADIQAQIDTLEQYKHSVITEAVTHGLNPDVPMKDSAVWFGKIPNSWTVVKGKYVFTQRNTRGNNIALQLLSPTQKYGVIPQEKYEELSGMSAVKLNDSTNFALLKTIHKGDYCISLRSFQGGFEYSEYEGVVSPAYQVFYPIVNVDRGYYKYLFKEKGFIEVMNSYTMSLRDGKNIAFDDFGNTFIPVPPVEEQKIIAEYLNKKCAEIEQTITDKKAQLDTLDEYKKSLIYEYVTGKKEVPINEL